MCAATTNISSLIRFESVSFMAQLMLRGRVVLVIMCSVPLTSFLLNVVSWIFCYC